MSLRSYAAVLAFAAGLSAISAVQAAQIANGLTTNGLTTNGLTTNGLTTNGLATNGTDFRGGPDGASSSTTQVKAVILRDGSKIDLR